MDLFIWLCVFAFLTFCGIIASFYLIDVLLMTDGIGYISLHRAVKNGDLKSIKQCLEQGDDVNAREWLTGRTPMHFYRSNDWSDNDLAILKILLDHGASVTLLDDEGTAAFAYLFTFGNRRTLQMLLQYDLDLYARDAYDSTPLHYLMMHDDSHIHELIEDKKFDIEARDSIGRTALSLAVSYLDVNRVEFLLKHGADVNIKDSDGNTLLYSAVYDTEMLDKYTMKMIDLLLEHGADLQQLPFHETDDEVAITFIESVIAHLAMIEHRGEVLTKFTRSQINSKPYFQDYFIDCKQQLEGMKKVVIYESVTLYKLFTENPNKIAYYTVDRGFSRKFDRVLNSMIETLDSYYYLLLRRRVGKAIQRAKVKARAAAAVCESTGFDFTRHRTIVAKITDYLNAEDLKYLDNYDEKELISLESLFL